MRNKNYTKRMLELRATAKSLAEQRADAVKGMQDIINASKTENRAITDEENTQLETLEKEIAGIDRTLAVQKRSLELFNNSPAEGESDEGSEETKGNASAEEQDSDIPEADRRAFMNTVNSLMEKRTGEQNFNMGNNGAIIPQSIAHRIITEVKEMCPILAGATMYAVKGTLKIPVYGDKTVEDTAHNITVDYAEEFSELTADAGAFTSIDLTGYLVGVLTLIGKSVINNSEIDVFGFIVREIAKRVALFCEKELLTGTGDTYNHCTGALSTTNTLNAESTTEIKADKLIELQAKVPTPYQANACWTMKPETFTAIRKLKDSTGQYLLQQNGGITNAFPYTLLGKPVHLSDNMPAIGSGNKAVLYGDYSGLSVNMRESMEMQALNEKYATQHAVGLVAWFEMDSKITEYEKLAALVMSVTA